MRKIHIPLSQQMQTGVAHSLYLTSVNSRQQISCLSFGQETVMSGARITQANMLLMHRIAGPAALAGQNNTISGSWGHITHYIPGM